MEHSTPLKVITVFLAIVFLSGIVVMTLPRGRGAITASAIHTITEDDTSVDAGPERMMPSLAVQEDEAASVTKTSEEAAPVLPFVAYEDPEIVREAAEAMDAYDLTLYEEYTARKAQEEAARAEAARKAAEEAARQAAAAAAQAAQQQQEQQVETTAAQGEGCIGDGLTY